MHESGVENVVASSGTALTQEQIRLIKRFTPNITMLYDGDPAGVKASVRGTDMVLEEGMNVRIVMLPEGEDPDSYSKRLPRRSSSATSKRTRPTSSGSRPGCSLMRRRAIPSGVPTWCARWCAP
ncbi:MAG: toprim domain-containing protein [Marinilabiliales bacterium]|nr:toprim domain-containing protein [Marinilabiliales bacterium]